MKTSAYLSVICSLCMTLPSSLQATTTNVFPETFHAGPDSLDEVLTMGWRGPTGDGASRDITVTFSSYQTFAEFGTLKGSLNEADVSGGQISKSLTGGASATLKVSLKSFAELPLRENHTLWACHIKITDLLKIPGEPKVKVVTHKYIARFASAIDPAAPSWEPHLIYFEPTRPGGETSKRLVVRPGNTVTKASLASPQSSAAFQWNNNADLFTFRPDPYLPWGVPTQLEEEVAILVEKSAIGYNNKHVGTLVLSGLVVPVRTYYFDRQGLLDILRGRGVHTVVANRLADNWMEALQNEDLSKGNSLAVESPEEADIRFRWVTSLKPLAETDIVNPPNAASWYAAIQIVGPMCTRIPETVPFVLGEHFIAPFHLKNGRHADPITITVKIRIPLLYQFSDPFLLDYEKDLEKAILHELGHALGFLGHIIPPIDKDTGSPKDIMQSGYEQDNQWTTVNSSAFLDLMGGLWSEENLFAALDLIERGQAPDLLIPGTRSHTFMGITAIWLDLKHRYPNDPWIAFLETFPDAYGTIPPLVHYGFNLDPVNPLGRSFTGGMLTSGMPVIKPHPYHHPAGLRIEYVRLRNTTLPYEVQTSSNLTDWQSSMHPATVTTLDAEWENVVIFAPANRSALFGRIVLAP